MKTFLHSIKHMKKSLDNIRRLFLTDHYLEELDELTHALQKREYRIENTINKLRMDSINRKLIENKLLGIT